MVSVTRRPNSGGNRRGEVESQLIAATERLLAEGTRFTELGVQRIAEAAGVARSTFYLHFPDKTALLLRLATTFQYRSFALVSGWQGTGDGGGGLDELVALYEAVLRLHRDHFPVLAAIDEAMAYDDEVRRVWESQLEQFATAASDRLARDQAAGLIPADLDRTAAVRVIVWGGYRAITQHIAGDDGTGDAAFARELANIMWFGAFRRPRHT
ncbi:MAG TPA: helix-turn-helix domain-containing protein [Amycolatopsis sp.]|jgi:AcrR family transcriptional regulator|nr:helix-turn-helix domain-containing protein [Amycolatopsis sp.]